MILLPIAVAHGVLFPVLHHGHSAHIDLIRQIEVDQAFRGGLLYPRWIADFYFGRGSPIFNFYAPLVYLVGEVFTLFGLSPLYAVKATYLLFVMLAGGAMYLLTLEIWGRRVAVACTSLYVLSPYLLVDLYVRSALAELSGFAFLPLAMYFFLRAAKTDSPTDAARAACAVALLCLTHNITALISAPLLLGWVIVIKDRASYGRLLFALMLGLALSSFFWLPALAEKRFLNAEVNLASGDYHYSNYFLSLIDLVRPQWGYGSPMNKSSSGMSTQIGIVHLLLAVPALLWLVRKRSWDLQRRAAAYFFGMSVLCAFFTTAWSKPFWDRLPLLPFVQFPFRFLLPVTLGMTVFAGASAWMAGERFGERTRNLISYVLIIAAVCAYASYAQARYLLHDRRNPNRILSVTSKEATALLRDPDIIEAQDLLTPWVLREVRESRSTALDDYLPRWVSEKPTSFYNDKAEAINGVASVEPLMLRQTKMSFHINAATSAAILVHTFYFPGWKARVGEDRLVVRPHEKTGEIVFYIPPGPHDVTLRFEDTRVRFLAKLISLLGIVVMIGDISVRQLARMRGEPAVPLRRRITDQISSRIRRRIDRRRHRRRHRPRH